MLQEALRYASENNAPCTHYHKQIPSTCQVSFADILWIEYRHRRIDEHTTYPIGVLKALRKLLLSSVNSH